VTGASFTWFPWGRGSYIKARAEWASIGHTFDVAGTTYSDSESGFGALFAVGYEWRAYRKLCAGPQIDFGYGKIHDGLSMNFANLTATMKWYF
jgi:hypothetical protein